MSTRCNIIIRDNNTSYTLYHHCDGYPAGVGKFLVDFFERGGHKFMNACAAVNSLLHVQEDGYKDRVNGYELAIEEAGDIEYLYHVRIDTDSEGFPAIVHCQSIERNYDNNTETRQYVNLDQFRAEA